MARDQEREGFLLRWSDHVPTSDIQDPLGLGLRGAARLADELLYCITSITPRARYFSFLPWCVLDHQKRERGQPHDPGRRKAIELREHALTLGCIAHHGGQPCAGGALVGSQKAAAWFTLRMGQAYFTRPELRFVQYPALDAYYGSLVNLGVFVTDEELPEADGEAPAPPRNFDDVELSPLGVELAGKYEAVVGGLAAVRRIATAGRVCPVAALREWGRLGGLCELAAPAAPDRPLLRDLFFAVRGTGREAHRTRRRSLLLLLELSRQLGEGGWALGHAAFADAVYLGTIVRGRDRLAVALPGPLDDLARRWRMFYFHYYMAVALEGAFAWLVTQLDATGLGGTTLGALLERLDQAGARAEVEKVLGAALNRPFGVMTPASTFACLKLPASLYEAPSTAAFDRAVPCDSPLAEARLEGLIRSGAYLRSAAGLALPMLLLATTLARYKPWETTGWAKWLANHARDRYLDLVPPVLLDGLEQRFGKWWARPWKEVAGHVLRRYVVQQHQSLSYEKSWAGDRCLLQVDGPRVFATGAYEKVGIGNPRLGSALQVLQDLALLEDTADGLTVPTKEGAGLLRRELRKEAGHEVR
jgi:hypothetical protein